EQVERLFRLIGVYQGRTVDYSAQVLWKDTESRSLSQLADALTKLVQGLQIPPDQFWPAVAQALGRPMQDVEAWRNAAEQPDELEKLFGELANGSQPTVGAEAEELKAKFDALGVAIRAGVEPEDAARRLGLAGIKFTGAVPVNLMPASPSRLAASSGSTPARMATPRASNFAFNSSASAPTVGCEPLASSPNSFSSSSGCSAALRHASTSCIGRPSA